MNPKPTIICLMGPTAAGKTDVAIELAQRLPCEIISVDSAMVYCGMDIGTAKPSAAMLALAPHRLIDIRNPNEPYSAALFCDDAKQAIAVILEKGKIPLLVGGTMLYFRALQQGLSALPSASPELRARLLSEALTEGWPALHKRLQAIDPQAAKRIHPHDTQRLQRALEIYELTGQSVTDLYAAESLMKAPYEVINVAVVPQDRQVLHQRIADRFSQMLQQGFVEEVVTLKKRWQVTLDMPAMRAVGYRQVWGYLHNLLNYEQMQEQGIIATRQLAKRQLTWLRSWPELQCFDSLAANYRQKLFQFIELKIAHKRND